MVRKTEWVVLTGASNSKAAEERVVWSLVRDFIEPLGYTEEEIFKEIWC